MKPAQILHADGTVRDGWPVEKLQERIDYYLDRQGTRLVGRDGEVILALADEVERLRADLRQLRAPHEADLIRAKIEALRTQRDWFRGLDMDVAADHCEEMAIAWDGDLLRARPRERERQQALDQHAAAAAWGEYRDQFGELDDLRPILSAYMAGWRASRNRSRP